MQRPELAPNEVDDRVADLLEHPAHDSVAAGVQCDLDDRLVRAGRPDDPRFVSGDWSVLQVDTGGQLRNGLRRDPARCLGDVGLHDPERRMREHVRQLAIIGEDKKPGCLRIQATDVEQPFVVLGDETLQIRTPTIIAQRAHDADGLVEHEVPPTRIELDRYTVDRDQVGLLDAPPQFGDDFAVDLNPAGRDEVLGDPTRRDTGRRHELLEPDSVGSRVARCWDTAFRVIVRRGDF